MTAVRRRLHIGPLLLGCLVSGGCLGALDDEGSAPMCHSDTDCNSEAGEVCDEGICWGNPPTGVKFAVVLVPPEDRPDLAGTELEPLDVAADGWISRLSFAEAIAVEGRVTLACSEGLAPPTCGSDSSLAAQIHVTRPGAVVGGPDYSRSTVAHAGVAPGESAFSLALPRLPSARIPYQVAVFPSDDGLGARGAGALAGTLAAELAPPLRFWLAGTRSVPDAEWVLGDPGQLVLVSGAVRDAAQRGIANMQVFLLRRTASGGSERVSSIAMTGDDGAYTIRILRDATDVPLELQVTPGPGTVAPAWVQRGLAVPAPTGPSPAAVALADIVMPSYPAPSAYVLPIKGSASGGGLEPIAGAEVSMTTVLFQSADTVVTFSAHGISDVEGNTPLQLIPGNLAYRARISPPPTAEHGAAFELSVQVGYPSGTGQSFLQPVALSRRVAVSGVVTSASGSPVAAAQITAIPSAALRLQLPDPEVAAIDMLQPPSTTTDATGEFVLWLDAQLGGTAAAYDLELVPPSGSRAPRWSLDGIPIQAAAGSDHQSQDLGQLELPAPAYARGVVTTPGGDAVPRAEVRLYQLPPDNYCTLLNLPPETTCKPPVRLRGLWRSDENGVVRLVLPRP